MQQEGSNLGRNDEMQPSRSRMFHQRVRLSTERETYGDSSNGRGQDEQHLQEYYASLAQQELVSRRLARNGTSISTSDEPLLSPLPTLGCVVLVARRGLPMSLTATTHELLYRIIQRYRSARHLDSVHSSTTTIHRLCHETYGLCCCLPFAARRQNTGAGSGGRRIQRQRRLLWSVSLLGFTLPPGLD